jgi:hypothetical protein
MILEPGATEETSELDWPGLCEIGSVPEATGIIDMREAELGTVERWNGRDSGARCEGWGRFDIVTVSDCALVSFLMKVSERVNTSELREGEFASATEFGWAFDFPKRPEWRGRTENRKIDVRKAAFDGEEQVGMTKSEASQMQPTVVTAGGM